jgi:hypothetical protein
MTEVTPCESLALLDCASWLIVSPYPCQVEKFKKFDAEVAGLQDSPGSRGRSLAARASLLRLKQAAQDLGERLEGFANNPPTHFSLGKKTRPLVSRDFKLHILKTFGAA